ncbi:hypothetical protein PHYBOEH_010534 [Phytophthora boehmeriae]|uniref:WRKY19-like zinc finger domain-containing protein n=1 Tax=Phytophthora boehmeriae TaxID=109152 RepID=A0A8T1VQ17_9STRA|nr:hypothetical protein PHYBOEH_010534 [Phytophthora boehmeriae]
MTSKTDIAFLLNPLAPTEHGSTLIALPTSPLASPSAVSSPERSFTSQRWMIAPYTAPLEKRRSGCKRRVMSMAALCSECFSASDDDQLDAAPSPTSIEEPPTRSHHPNLCRVEDCMNIVISRGCCVRHGGGSKCIEAGCNKRAKLYQRCYQHGGYTMCTESGCTKKAKRFGLCWSHGGGHICEVSGCKKVSTQGGYCWAHGGGNRCKHDGCNRRSYRKLNYYCKQHAK